MRRLLLTIVIMALGIEGWSLDVPQPVTAITLPQIGQPFLGPLELAGLSGFFLTRQALEDFVLAKESIPIKDKQIIDLTKIGQSQAKVIDTQATKINELEGWLQTFKVGLIVIPLVAVLIDEIYHASVK